ncbi:septum formation family protein [Virgisporangium ochraceum]|uniref:septum formation family protein n=1 Tax=Virgisporangium ochraceum TaxID=65505 RepID=UPI001940CC0A|nr:septum formation family protein [Virgisporangium ochraceum]
MTRAIASTSLAVLVLFGGSACAGTPGDGNLSDDWATMADPRVRVPEVGRCYNGADVAQNSYPPNWYRPVPCEGTHTAETFHVDELPAEVSERPALGHRHYWAAFDTCETQSKAFLGGDWHAARLYLSVFVPTPPQWDVGARWFACQVVETKTVLPGLVVQRSGSLRNALTGPAAVAHRCTDVIGLTEDDWEDLTPVDCAQPHDVEFAGSFKVPGTTAPAADKREGTFDRCWDVVAGYLGGTVDGMRMGYIPWGLDPKDWSNGDRWVRCFAWSSEKKTRGSVKGLGDRTPPS